MANKLAFLEWCRTDGTSLQQQLVEHTTIIQHHIKHGLIHAWSTIFLNITCSQLINQIWNRNLAWANAGTLTAANTQITKFVECFYTVEQACKNSTNTTGIDMTINMTANQSPDWAYIQAGSTAYTLESLLQYRILSSLQTTIIQKDYILLAVSFHMSAIFILVNYLGRSVYHSHIAGHALAGTISRQEPQDAGCILSLRNQLFITNQYNMDSWQSSYQTSITLIGNQTDSTIFRNTEISTGYTHISMEEFLPKSLSGQLNHIRNILARYFMVNFFFKHLGTLIAIQMNSWHNHMGWTLTSQSNHPLTQVCFLYPDTIISKAFIHMNFFGSHGFRFYYPFYIVFLANINEDFLYLISVLSTENFGTTLLQACLKFIC